MATALAGKQSLDATLTALAALDGTAGILRQTGADTFARLADTAAGRVLLEAADAAAQRTALGLGTAALVSTGTGAANVPTSAQADLRYQPLGATSTTIATSSPSAPATGSVVVHAMDVAGRAMLASRSPLGRNVAQQPHLGMVSRMEVYPQNNSTTLSSSGGTLTALGTATARSVAAGSYFSWCRRLSYVSAAGSGSSALVRALFAAHGLGDAAGAGGFTAVFRFGVGDAAAVANARMFVGFYVASSIGNVEPSSLTNTIGIGCDAGEATLSMIHNDAAGTATKVALGASFPADTQSVDVYELVLYAPPNSSTVGYRVTRLNTGDTATGILLSNLPAGSQLLAPQFWRNSGATAAAVDVAIMGLYVETDQ
jgi:hypothetical protein